MDAQRTADRLWAMRRAEAALSRYPSARRLLASMRADVILADLGVSYDTQIARQSASSSWSDATSARGIALAAHQGIAALEREIRAVETVLRRLPASWRRLVALRYWSPRRPTWTDVARQLGVSRRTALYRRATLAGWLWAELAELEDAHEEERAS